MLSFVVASTQSRLHRLCLYLLNGTAAPDWTAPGEPPDCTHLPLKLHTAAKQSVPLLLYLVWGAQTPTGLSRQSCRIMTLPLTSNTDQIICIYVLHSASILLQHFLLYG